MSHSERSDGQADDVVVRALREAVARQQGDLTVSELIRLAIELDVPAAELLEAAVATEEGTDDVSRARPGGRPPGRRRPRRP